MHYIRFTSGLAGKAAFWQTHGANDIIMQMSFVKVDQAPRHVRLRTLKGIIHGIVATSCHLRLLRYQIEVHVLRVRTSRRMSPL